MIPLPAAAGPPADCWNRIGVRGDRSCPLLPPVVHCQNCDVFSAAGRRFLNSPSPPGYLDEWTERLARPIEEDAADLVGLLIFRLAEEWLALPLRALVEVRPRSRSTACRTGRGFSRASSTSAGN